VKGVIKLLDISYMCYAEPVAAAYCAPYLPCIDPRNGLRKSILELCYYVKLLIHK